jgi:hypothetical protein
MCERKRISKQDAVDGLLTWVMTQDEVVQSMVLGQIRPQPDLIELVLRRLGNPASHPSRLPAEAPPRPKIAGSRPRVGGA